jgi:peptidoglycan pentaglycine glycine transferase (the first glycine)
MKSIPRGYRRFDENATSKGLSAWIDASVEDHFWDEFLQATPLGQFQQSSIWARAKQLEGWKLVRVVVTRESEIVAGFQILWRSSWRGRLGYLTKGPVVLPGHEDVADYTADLLRKVARRERLRALIVQPPDLCTQMPERVVSIGSMPDVVAKVNDATWICDLRDGFEAVERRMSKETRKKIKQATNRGLTVREGGREDLQVFFDLMLSTCQRQQVAPNPPGVEHLLALWDAAHGLGCIRLSFVEFEGKPLTGQLCLGFGKTLCLWRKGWTCTEGQRNPNDLSIYETLRWACQAGYEFCDFSAFDRSMAISILTGKPLSIEQERSRHMFHLRFGGSPRLLPKARIYFPNVVFKSAYRILLKKQLRNAQGLSASEQALVNNVSGMCATGAGNNG